MTRISFDVEGKPPKKSQWNLPSVIEFREKALQARKNKEIPEGYDGPVKLNLIVFAPNILDMEYKQTGDDDSKKFVGDLDSFVSGICEYLQPAPTNPEIEISPLFNGKDEIGPLVPLIIKNDSQITEIIAKKVQDEKLYYHIDIDFI